MKDQGHYTESGLITADTLIKQAPGYVQSIMIAYEDVVPGEICTLRDALNESEGANEVLFRFPDTCGIIIRDWPGEGKKFDTGIYFNKGTTEGTLHAEITYK